MCRYQSDFWWPWPVTFSWCFFTGRHHRVRVLLRIIRRQAIGDITTQESSHSAPIIRIGRGADCDIHLPDAGIQLEHATLESRGDYAFIQAVGHASISVNEKVVDGIRLQVGDRIRLGLYELKVQESIEAVDGDEALVLTCERYEPDDAVLLGKAGTTTGSGVGARLGMRGLSWALGSLIFLMFFVWPIAAHYSAESRDVGALDTAMTAGHQPVGDWTTWGRSAWLTGAVSRSHALFGDECTSCHQKAFVPVNATDCLTCHNDLQEHVRVEQFSFASLDATGCLQCHQEHEGNDQLVLNDSRLCVNCHQNLAATSKGLVEVSDVVSFSQHPEFRVHGVKSN
ncbi:MAG TPA: FHA domain-containing protein, partial [Acidobacteria bacterium]|nr:FHA domain-containing protein [Acidobacteriota bacterium]